jgi:hypothetical protein
MQEVKGWTIIHRESYGLVETDTECHITGYTDLSTKIMSCIFLVAPETY